MSKIIDSCDVPKNTPNNVVELDPLFRNRKRDRWGLFRNTIGSKNPVSDINDAPRKRITDSVPGVTKVRDLDHYGHQHPEGTLPLTETGKIAVRAENYLAQFDNQDYPPDDIA